MATDPEVTADLSRDELASTSQPEYLGPSALGTKEYWEHTYRTDLANFADNPADGGTIWFSESNAEGKVVSYLAGLARHGILRKQRRDEAPGKKDATSFLDLGTGNGHMLLALREAGWQGNMIGVDYSPASVEMAQKLGETWRTGLIDLDISDDEDEKGEDDQSGEEIAEERSEGKNRKRMGVQFIHFDILADDIPDPLGHGFDVVLDKGTFDAISLSADEDSSGQRKSQTYQAQVERMVKPGGLLIVVSCNWTEDELRGWLLKGGFKEFGRIEYPSFTFGGQKGQQICTLCFQRALVHK